MPTPTLLEVLFAPYVTGPVGLASGMVFKHIKSRYWDLRGLRGTLEFCKAGAFIFLPLYQHNAAVGSRAGYGDMVAFADLHAAATNLGLQREVETIVTQPGPLTELERGRNLVILGGGKANHHHLALIGELAPPLHYWDVEGSDNKTLRNKNSTQTYQPSVENGVLTHDIGLAIYGANPYNPERKVVICAGSYTFGTAAAMRYLLSKSGTEKIRAAKGNHCLFAVEAEVKNQKVAAIRLLAEEYGPWK